jgi:parvulin-like peptidyl-prolyl isomerase
MTLRARPVARRRGRAGWDSGDRRNSLINLGFLIAIVVSVLILIGFAAWSWYDGHYGAAATVNGQVITKDDLVGRLKIENFRLDYVQSRIKTLEALGRISSADAQTQIDFIGQRREQLANLTLERLVDTTLMAKLAADNAVEVSDADIDAQLVDEATTSEQRHVWMIEIEPATDAVTGKATEEDRRAALGRAQRALARLKSGESWDDVARTASDSGLAPQSGDLGWLSKDSGYDEAFMEAVFATDVQTPTQVIEGDDGTFRIGRYTETAASQVDSSFQAQIQEEGILLADYRVAARGDVIRKKLSDKIVADLSKPGLQRHVLEIYLPEPNESSVTGEPGSKVRWIVFSPNDDIAKAKEVKADDPAWTKAKADADAAYATLKADLTKFDAKARADSDERSAQLTGGKQPWIYHSTAIDAAVRDPILADGRTPNELLAPIKGELGWYVIEYMRPIGAGEAKALEALKPSLGTDAAFKQAAIDISEGPEAKDGGDLGWIAQTQLADQLDAKLFSTTVGSVSDVVTISGDGSYLLRVLAEETKTPTDDQLKIIKDSGFSTWYTRQKEAATIEYKIGTPAGTA